MYRNKTRTLNILIYTLIGLCTIACSPTAKEASNSKAEPLDNILIKGAFFQGANGLYFDDNDQLHVASVVGRLVGVVDTDNGEIIDTLTVADGVEGPDDLTFGSDGSLYFTSILTGEVGRVAPDGTSSRQFLSPGANPITFSDDGRLFVALDFQGDGLYELDPELKDPPRLIIKELGWLNGMDFGPDGYLYGPVWSKGHIVKINVDNGSLEVIVDDLKTPAAVKFDSKGTLHTIDHKTGEIYQINVETGEKLKIASGPEYVGADNLAFNSKDELFVSHAQDGSLYQVNKDGSKRVIISPSICNAADIEVVGNRILVPDILSMKSLNGQGEISHTWHHMIGSQGVIGPFTIDSEGDKLALTSWFSNEVQVWNVTTNEAEATYHDLVVPLNAILYKGELIIAELGVSPGAAMVTRRLGDNIEILLDASGGLIVPSGLACDDANCYVADYYQGKILQFIKDGENLDVAEVILDSLQLPEGLQIGPKGNLIIVETGADRILSYNKVTQEKMVLVDDIPLGLTAPQGMPPTWKLSDISFDDEGTLYVPSDIDNVIYRFEGKFD
ncbi:MAG: SMP-30/gluconolactonase/LRE family protein [Saprospiraceae bacterium]|nr:SMP-30/gluconolactonase/LRE family protein [Saprospiraceae bacterium]